MQKPHFPKVFSKLFPKRLFTKSRMVWMATFIFAFAFLLANTPLTKLRAVVKDSAGAIYISNFNKDTGEQDGFLVNLISGVGDTLRGNAVVTNTTATGSAVIEYKGGVATALSDVGDYLYENPTGSAMIWAQDQIQQITSGKKFVAFAYDPNDTDIYQVSGYTALSNTIGLWNWSRNIVYAIFIIILIAVAFMILFRRSLGGQQYITLTNSLPSIILSLVLITFSYPISAAFIDAVSIGCNVAYNVIIAAPNAPGRAFIDGVNGSPVYVNKVHDTGVVQTVYNASNTPGSTIVNGVNVTGGTQIKNILQPDDQQMSLWAVFYTSNAQVCGKINIFGVETAVDTTPNATANCEWSKFMAPTAMYGIFGSIINGIFKALSMTGLGNVLVEVAMLFLIISTELKILKRLLTDYLILSFFPILSPWLFLVAALPNRTSKVIGDFVKILGWSALNMIIIYACFLILIVLGYSSAKTVDVLGDNGVPITGATFQLGDAFKGASQLKWVPPMLGYSYGQIVGDSSVTGSNGNTIITTIIIIAFFMAIPRIPEEIQSWMQVPQLPALLRNTGQDLSQGVQGAGKAVAGGAGALSRIKLGGGQG